MDQELDQFQAIYSFSVQCCGCLLYVEEEKQPSAQLCLFSLSFSSPCNYQRIGSSGSLHKQKVQENGQNRPLSAIHFNPEVK